MSFFLFNLISIWVILLRNQIKDKEERDKEREMLTKKGKRKLNYVQCSIIIFRHTHTHTHFLVIAWKFQWIGLLAEKRHY
jgi:hypothetical protein